MSYASEMDGNIRSPEIDTRLITSSKYFVQPLFEPKFELAVKYSKAGDEVEARVGGEIFWEDGLREQSLEEKPNRREASMNDIAGAFFSCGRCWFEPLMSVVSHLESLNLKTSSPERKSHRTCFAFGKGKRTIVLYETCRIIWWFGDGNSDFFLLDRRFGANNFEDNVVHIGHFSMRTETIGTLQYALV
jgi:hypothetical protein